SGPGRTACHRHRRLWQRSRADRQPARVGLGQFLSCHRGGAVSGQSPPAFDAAFREQLAALLAWRRDVRRFRETPVPEALIDELLDLVQLSPSVGNSQPWRWVRVDSPDKRTEIRANFLDCNARAHAEYPDEHADAYAALK